MAWQSLYRRYRPRRFGEVRGQDHVVTALRNAVREGRVGHAYLLSGPRGTGKTTCARVLAKALNCEHVVDGEPDLTCASCVAIEAGTSFDLHELDAASNNKTDDIRDLISKVNLGTPGRTKVYILDEVHMLTEGAENALLKTLEEPPEHVVFVLATTDPHKVRPTIRSRTQHFELHLLPADELEALVRWVAADAGLDVDDDVVAHVVRAGSGSARDTLSALDQVVAAGGLDDRDADVGPVLDALLDRDCAAALAAVHATVGAGRDPRTVAEALVGRLRDAFLASVGVAPGHLAEADRPRTAELAARVDRPFLTRSLEVLGEALVAMRQAADPRITLETALVRLADVGSDTSVAALVERIDRLEQALAAGGPTPSPAPAATGGPADEARRQARAGAAAPSPAPAPTAAPPPAGGPADEARRRARAGSATPVPPTDDPAPPAPAPAPAAAGPLPSRDELTIAWGDHVLAVLPGPARARFMAGRFVDGGDGAVDFALPNDAHRTRCEEYRPAVEAALAAHFGRPVPLRLVVEGPEASTPAPAERQLEGADELVDLDDLVDAPAVPQRSPAERLTDAFPGAVLEENR